MKNRDLEEFLDTLGHDSLSLLVQTDSLPTSKHTNTTPQKISIVCDTLADDNQKLLLEKMIMAMGLSQDKYHVFTNNQINSESAPTPGFTIIFGHNAHKLFYNEDSFGELKGKVISKNHRFTLSTFHPSELLTKPELKKEAWSDLQKVMRLEGFPR